MVQLKIILSIIFVLLIVSMVYIVIIGVSIAFAKIESSYKRVKFAYVLAIIWMIVGIKVVDGSIYEYL